MFSQSQQEDPLSKEDRAESEESAKSINSFINKKYPFDMNGKSTSENQINMSMRIELIELIVADFLREMPGVMKIIAGKTMSEALSSMVMKQVSDSMSMQELSDVGDQLDEMIKKHDSKH